MEQSAKKSQEWRCTACSPLPGEMLRSVQCGISHSNELMVQTWNLAEATCLKVGLLEGLHHLKWVMSPYCIHCMLFHQALMWHARGNIKVHHQNFRKAIWTIAVVQSAPAQQGINGQSRSGQPDGQQMQEGQTILKKSPPFSTFAYIYKRDPSSDPYTASSPMEVFCWNKRTNFLFPCSNWTGSCTLCILVLLAPCPESIGNSDNVFCWWYDNCRHTWKVLNTYLVLSMETCL